MLPSNHIPSELKVNAVFTGVQIQPVHFTLPFTPPRLFDILSTLSSFCSRPLSLTSIDNYLKQEISLRSDEDLAQVFRSIDPQDPVLRISVTCLECSEDKPLENTPTGVETMDNRSCEMSSEDLTSGGSGFAPNFQLHCLQQLLSNPQSMGDLRQFLLSALQTGSEHDKDNAVADLLAQFDHLHVKFPQQENFVQSQKPMEQELQDNKELEQLVQALLSTPGFAELVPAIIGYLFSQRQQHDGPLSFPPEPTITVAPETASRWNAESRLSESHHGPTNLVLLTCCFCNRIISGVRYSCSVCPDFDLCASCEEVEGTGHDPSHVFYKFRPGAAVSRPKMRTSPYSSFSRKLNSRRFRQCLYGKGNRDTRVMAHFVEDVTLDPGTPVESDSAVVKIWRLRNDSVNSAWPAGTTVRPVLGDTMDSSTQIPVMSCGPSRTMDIAIDLVVPREEGRYCGEWQLHGPDDTPFGDMLKVDILAFAAPETRVISLGSSPALTPPTPPPVVSSPEIPSLENESSPLELPVRSWAIPPSPCSMDELDSSSIEDKLANS